MPLRTEQYRVLDHSSHAAAKQRDACSPGRLLLSFVIEGGYGYYRVCNAIYPGHSIRCCL